MFRKIVSSGLVCVTTVTLFSSSAFGASLQDSTTVRSPFVLGDVNDRSYDGPGFDAFKPFDAFTSSEVLSVNTFTGGDSAVKHELFLLSEVAYYDGTIPGLGDTFGMLGAGGGYNEVIEAGFNPGDSASIVQGKDEEFTLAMKGPEGTFSSIDGDNADGAAHILGKEVTSAGTVFIEHANLHGASLFFDLQVGDIVLFIEDLLISGNKLFGGLPTDADYNDMVVVVRTTEVPEPATLMLLVPALCAASRRRKQARA